MLGRRRQRCLLRLKLHHEVENPTSIKEAVTTRICIQPSERDFRPRHEALCSMIRYSSNTIHSVLRAAREIHGSQETNPIVAIVTSTDYVIVSKSGVASRQISKYIDHLWMRSLVKLD